MSKKLYDLAVKTGEYMTREGGTKNRYVNVGSVMANDDGGKFIILHRHFNPAGVPNPDNRDSLLVSMFEPREYGERQAGAPPAQSGQPPRQAPTAPPPADDDIPF